MAGLFDALGTATRGMQVVQRGMAVTGHNIANVDTEGYSRQRAILVTGEPQPDATGTIGSGVEQLTVERVVDTFIGKRLISETSRQAGLETEASIYREIETVVNDQLSGGLTEELSRFFDALDDLANSPEPGQAVARGQVLSTAESFVDTVHRWDDQLRTLQRDADQGIVGLMPEINALAAEIASLNGQIAEAETIAPANDLRDRQEQLVRDLAQRIDVTSVSYADGTVSIRLSNGVALVDQRRAAELEVVVDPMNPNPLDPTFAQVYYRGAGGYQDVTGVIRGGELGALIDARENIIAGAVAELDAFAFTFAESFNAEHRLGVGIVNDAANDFFQDMSGQATIDGAARNLRIADAVDPSLGGSTGNIAAGSRPGGGAAGEALLGDTTHVQALKALRTGQVTSYLAGDVPGNPTGGQTGIAARLINFTAEIGQQTRSSERALRQQEAVLTAVQQRRDSISGVSVDEEVAELIKLQANFQANARVVRTVTETLQALFDAL